jgi:hypothetical protein
VTPYEAQFVKESIIALNTPLEEDEADETP